MKRTVAAGCVAAVCVGGAIASEPPRRLTLDEAESAALAHHERIQVAAAEQQRAAIGSWRAATLVAPSVAETASYEHQKDEISFPTGQTSPGQSFNPVILQENATRSILTVTQPLFRGQFSPTRVGLSAISFASFLGLGLWELRHPEPVADLRLFRYRAFAISSVLQILLAFALYGNVLTFPLYLQTLSGYTAFQAGLANAPRGVATMLGMLVVGAVYGRVDTRIILAIGFALITLGGFEMAHYTTQWGFWEYVWPSLIHGLGMGFTFVPLSAAALASVPPRRMENASGLFNLIRAAGGSFGIATCGTLIVRRAQLHQSVLVNHASPANPISGLALDDAIRLAMGQGLDVTSATERAHALVYAFIQREAATLAFEDAFRFLAWLSAAMIPLLFVIGKIRGELRAAH